MRADIVASRDMSTDNENFSMNGGGAGSDALLLHNLGLLARQMPAVFAGNFLVAAVTPMALWTLSNRTWLLAWSAAVIVLTLVRMGVLMRFRRANPDPRGARAWAWVFTFFSFVSGCLWGATGLLFFDPGTPLSVVYVAIVLSGMVGGSVASLSNFLPAYFGFAIPALTPVMVYSFWIGGPIYTTVGLLALFMLVVNLSYSRSVNRTISQAIRLRFENIELIGQLQGEKSRAESANRAKSVFLAAVSHDLRQPSHALGLFVETLMRGNQREGGLRAADIAKLGERMRASLQQLHGLLNGVLDVSRLDAGVIAPERRVFSISGLFDTAAATHTEHARQKGLRLRFRPSELLIESDPVLLARILSNLVSNAVRYTESGGVLVGARRRGEHVRIEVWDTGHGIPRERTDQIFEEFVQLENPSRDHSRGLGLGLAIVRRTARLLDHAVEVHSRAGRGSCFYVLVPRAMQAADARPPAPAGERPKGGRRVLVIDDEDTVRDASAELLREWGYEPVLARGTQDAMASAREISSLALIIADYRLAKEETGAQAIDAVRAILGTSVPAIIITGDTSPERLRELQASGHPVLHKPIEGAELLNQIQKLIVQGNADLL